LSIGDAIIDAVELAPGKVEYFPEVRRSIGVGIARLGLTSQLATRFGADRYGFLIERYLREEGVRIFIQQIRFHRRRLSRRKNGEPTYEFTPVMFRRRIAFTSEVLAAIGTASAVAVNSSRSTMPDRPTLLSLRSDKRPGWSSSIPIRAKAHQ